jgi:Holliday junction resolvase RusA-like endonuclease
MQTLTIPNWYPVSLNEMAGYHWSVKARLKRQDVDMIAGYAMQAGLRKASCKRYVRIYFHGWHRGRRPDPDNLLKSLLDAMVQAGLLVDDSLTWCEWERPEIIQSTVKQTVITISDEPFVR